MHGTANPKMMVQLRFQSGCICWGCNLNGRVLACRARSTGSIPVSPGPNSSGISTLWRGWLTQWLECFVYTEKVSGSSPLLPRFISLSIVLRFWRCRVIGNPLGSCPGDSGSSPFIVWWLFFDSFLLIFYHVINIFLFRMASFFIVTSPLKCESLD